MKLFIYFFIIYLCNLQVLLQRLQENLIMNMWKYFKTYVCFKNIFSCNWVFCTYANLIYRAMTISSWLFPWKKNLLRAIYKLSYNLERPLCNRSIKFWRMRFIFSDCLKHNFSKILNNLNQFIAMILEKTHHLQANK